MSHKITIICDSCEKEYMMDDEMEMPPYWLGVQFAVANKDGMIPLKDIFVHVCSQKCLIEYVKGNVIKERILLVDKKTENE